MKTVDIVKSAVLGLGNTMLARVPSDSAVQASLSDYQGAWVLEGRDCEDVYSSEGTAPAFKKPIDIFAPAFIVSGKRLRTPMATCQIRSVRPAGDRQRLLLDCTNSVAGNEVTVLMAPASEVIKRYYNDQDTTGVGYRRCSR